MSDVLLSFVFVYFCRMEKNFKNANAHEQSMTTVLPVTDVMNCMYLLMLLYLGFYQIILKCH